MLNLLRTGFVLVCLTGSLATAYGAEWVVPAGGNAFQTAPSPSGKGFQTGGAIAWSEVEDCFAIYFHVDRPATVELSLVARVPSGESQLVAQFGEKKLPVKLHGTEFNSHPLGQIELTEAGYNRVELQGVKKSGMEFAEIRDLVVASETENLKVDFVRNNEGNMFYWGRRGPSVHLSYEIPKETQLQYAYTEVTVPQGEDVIGSYFMANGFGEGYFGIQVNNSQERRILFSVWSPFKTDNPRDIPEEQRIKRLGSGRDVHVGEFGNEGAGGQSYLVYPWKAATTYAFLTEVKPSAPSSTDYTCWFRDLSAVDWQLVASFRRPQTTTYLRGFHSFLENFNPATGHIARQAHYGNVWVRDVADSWHPCTKARFSVDATGSGHHRLDFQGGAAGDHFILRNCGFFANTGKPGTVFTRQLNPEKPPEINFAELPRK